MKTDMRLVAMAIAVSALLFTIIFSSYTIGQNKKRLQREKDLETKILVEEILREELSFRLDTANIKVDSLLTLKQNLQLEKQLLENKLQETETKYKEILQVVSGILRGKAPKPPHFQDGETSKGTPKEVTVVGESKKHSAYIARYKATAIEISAKLGKKIPPSIIMAQAILEGGGGTSTLASKWNNHFGHKFYESLWTKQSMATYLDPNTPWGTYNDDDPTDKFCHYKSTWLSFLHHGKWLQKKRYSALQLKKPVNWAAAKKMCGFSSSNKAREKAYDKSVEHWDNEFYKWAYGLYACGYATASYYPDSLIRIYKEYNLASLDHEI